MKSKENNLTFFLTKLNGKTIIKIKIIIFKKQSRKPK